MNEGDEIKRISKLYDYRAYKSDSIQAAGQWGTAELANKIVEEIIKKINLKKGDTVLEIGCGSGVLGNAIAKNCNVYAGFDASLSMLKKFQTQYSDQSTNNLVLASASEIPFKSKSFDKVVMNGVSMYFPNEKFLQKVLMESERVAKKNAVIFIGENIIPSRYYWELVWFENLSPIKQFFAKPYIRLRKWLASKSDKLAGKWKYAHKDVSPKSIKKFFRKRGTVEISDAAAYTIRKKKYGLNTKGNRRVDFLIKLDQ